MCIAQVVDGDDLLIVVRVRDKSQYRNGLGSKRIALLLY